MTPASQVFPKKMVEQVIYAKDQPEYIPLPAVTVPGEEGRIITRWRCSWGERLRVLLRGDVYLEVLTFGRTLQPVKLSATEPTP